MIVAKTDPCRLSIITINKNNSEGLRKTAESVLNQTVNDFQYIIIDGASTDTSIDILKDYQDRIDYWISEPDNGIYNAMNKGIKKAKGKYCLFLNSGDFLYKENVIENYFEENLNSDIIACAIESVSKNANGYIFPPKEISLLTFTRGSLLHPATFIKRDLFEKYGYYDENYKILSDWKFFLEVLIIHNCSYSSKMDIISVFDSENGLSSLHNDSERQTADNILKAYFPRIYIDYFLDEKIEYEYFQNIFSILVKNRFALLLLRPFLRFINRITGGRNKNNRLISVKKANKT